ncbi:MULTISPECIES: HAD-IIA family hydrolase [Paenibacillus]|uniref:HAD-IIA family hydrolase n=1 Tax=Paenibacillus TaxID=44249 RepID=UPI000B7D14FB|nr:HAD-IIA family hydrolase [Paenibacillus sp. SSG-1]OXL84532.1 haloacid dehalogenase [Paenibacillus sp. SSG-1]
MSLETVDGFIIDLDGTVYRGAQAIPGAKESIALLRSQGKRMVFLSNRGNISRAMCHQKLLSMGIDVPAEEILLTSTVTARYLQQHHSGSQAWVLGPDGLRDELVLAGIGLAERPENADWLVITLHEELTYAELNQAFRAVRNGARIIATNDDKSFPGDDGECIDVGGMIAAIVATAGQEVEVVIGKPSALMAEAALQVLGLPPQQCLVIGDSLGSDIQLGRRAGIRTALVLSGSATRRDAETAAEGPDMVWESLAELQHLLKGKEGIK